MKQWSKKNVTKHRDESQKETAFLFSALTWCVRQLRWKKESETTFLNLPIYCIHAGGFDFDQYFIFCRCRHWQLHMLQIFITFYRLVSIHKNFPWAAAHFHNSQSEVWRHLLQYLESWNTATKGRVLYCVHCLGHLSLSLSARLLLLLLLLFPFLRIGRNMAMASWAQEAIAMFVSWDSSGSSPFYFWLTFLHVRKKRTQKSTLFGFATSPQHFFNLLAKNCQKIFFNLVTSSFFVKGIRKVFFLI